MAAKIILANIIIEFLKKKCITKIKINYTFKINK